MGQVNSEHAVNGSLVEKSEAGLKQIHCQFKGRAKKRHSYGSRPMGKGEQEEREQGPQEG